MTLAMQHSKTYDKIEIMVVWACAVASWAALFLRKPNKPVYNRAVWVVHHDRHLNRLNTEYEKLR